VLFNKLELFFYKLAPLTIVAATGRMSQQQSLIRIPNQHQRLLQQLREERNNLKSFDPSGGVLITLPW
jgi:hypothetical protein